MPEIFANCKLIEIKKKSMKKKKHFKQRSERNIAKDPIWTLIETI